MQRIDINILQNELNKIQEMGIDFVEFDKDYRLIENKQFIPSLKTIVDTLGEKYFYDRP